LTLGLPRVALPGQLGQPAGVTRNNNAIFLVKIMASNTVHFVLFGEAGLRRCTPQLERRPSPDRIAYANLLALPAVDIEQAMDRVLPRCQA
jgi:hypothetical protein